MEYLWESSWCSKIGLIAESNPYSSNWCRNLILHTLKIHTRRSESWMAWTGWILKLPLLRRSEISSIWKVHHFSLIELTNICVCMCAHVCAFIYINISLVSLQYKFYKITLFLFKLISTILLKNYKISSSSSSWVLVKNKCSNLLHICILQYNFNCFSFY